MLDFVDEDKRKISYAASYGYEKITKEEKNNLVHQWTSTNEPHRIKGLDKGKYILTEINVVLVASKSKLAR